MKKHFSIIALVALALCGCKGNQNSNVGGEATDQQAETTELSEVVVTQPDVEAPDIAAPPASFAPKGNNRDELYLGDESVDFSEGDLNGDGIGDLLVLTQYECGVYFKDADSVYTFKGYAAPADTELDFYAYISDGNLMIDASYESSKLYTLHYQDGDFYLVYFRQDMEWPDGGGEYHETDDYVTKKRHVWTENSDETTDISSKPMLIISEIHFGYIDEGPY